MSCETNGKKVGGTAGVAAGLPASISKANFALGAISNQILNTIDREGTLAQLTRSKQGGRYRNRAFGTLVGTGVVAATAAAPEVTIPTLLFGAVLARRASKINPDTATGPLSKQSITVPGLFGQKQVEVPVYQEKGNPGRRVFRVKKTNWVVQTHSAKVEQGQLHPYTSLETKAAIPQCYFFNRTLSDEEAVHIASGQREAHKIPGYVGTLSYREALTPIWGTVKVGMIHASVAHQLRQQNHPTEGE
ncbi:MAG: hypothetical protein BroJett011_59580 [Chloroflexota bacterium]|nr:MAG: hypothetical protein BroJett011_59580 [Chloroflexota bacterium]